MLSPIMMIIVMIITSFIIDYFTMTILLTDNITFNLNKIYGSLLMGMLMGLIQLFMLKEDFSNNMFWVLTILIIIIVLSLVYAIREQWLIDDKQFELSMIEHHAMAIAMANKFKNRTRDPELYQLSNDIINSQQSEIDFLWRKYKGSIV